MKMLKTMNRTASLIINNLKIVNTPVRNQSDHSNMKMEKTINQVTLLGRVGNDPQKRGTDEHPVVTFSLATHNNYKYATGDMLQRTDWHRISIFRPNLRESVYNYLKKGQRVYVTGRITYSEINMDDGQVRTASSVIAEDVIFFQTKPNSE